jgi:hypothetical protein
MGRYFGLAALLAFVGLLAFTGVASAADGLDIGQNLGRTATGIAKALFLGVVAVVGLIFIVNRRYTDLAVFLVAVVIVGGLIFEQGTLRNTVQDIWKGLVA